MKYIFQLSLILFAASAILSSCGAKGEKTGYEYAPQMYHAVPYEPLKQVMDKESGMIITSTDDREVGEFYNGNPNNPYAMSMREPAPNSVRRQYDNQLFLRIPKDSLEMAARLLKNPYPASSEVIADGKVLYQRFCIHCHGAEGKGGETGKVGAVYLGVPSYTSAAIKDKPNGHVFQVITHGKGRMGAHGSQLSVDERWMVTRYVETLQNQ